MSVKVNQFADGSTFFMSNGDAPRPCDVYLVMATAHGLVYVGIADDFEKRWRQHRRSSWWLGEVVVDEVRVYSMASREHARQMEAAIINCERPMYNTALEAGAFVRYQEAAASNLEDPWPVVGQEIYNGEGELQWSTF